MKNTPKVPTISVYMPVYNCNGYLSYAIESILAQSFTDFEFIIIDDGSTDSSKKTISKYAKLDKRIRAFSNQTNQGVSYTANRAIGKCRGQFIARMDADDISFPERLARQLNFLKKHPDTVACGTQCLVIDEKNMITGEKTFPTKSKDLRKMAFFALPMQQPSVMVNRALLPKNFTWYFDKRSAGEDVGFIFRLLKYGEIGNLSEKLLCYRDTPNSLTKRRLRATSNSIIQGRLQAIHKGHRPSLLFYPYCLIQFLAIAILPPTVVLYCWSLIRGMRKVNLKSYNQQITTPSLRFTTA